MDEEKQIIISRDQSAMKFATNAIHTGNEPEPTTGAIMPPIYMTSHLRSGSPGKSKALNTRANNPNFEFLEKQLAALEDANMPPSFLQA